MKYIRFFSGVIFAVVFTGSILTNNKPKKTIAKYYFAQQTNDICLMVPIMNLEILENFKKAKYDVSKIPAYTRAEWFGVLNPYEIAWFKPFADLNVTISNNHSHYNDYESLKTYLDNATLHGPIFPYFYDKKGKFPLGGFLKGIDEVKKFMSLPYMLIDVNGPKELNSKIFFNLVDIAEEFGAGISGAVLKLPVLQNGNDVINKKLLIFNQKKKKYELRDEKDYLISSEVGISLSGEEFEFKTFNVSKDNNPIENFYMSETVNKLLFQTYSHVGLYEKLGQPYENKKSAYIPYMQGIYKLMLLSLGINHDNRVLAIDGKETKLFDIYGELDVMIALQNICNADQDNPWNEKRFNKDMFLPYVITDILQKNTKLTNQLKQTVDISFHEWDEYQKLVNGAYYNKDKEQMTFEKIAQFVPGEHQILAFILMKNIRLLWYGSQNPKVFYHETMPKSSLLWTFDNFVKNASHKKKIKNGVTETASFLDTWILIRDEIIKTYKRKDWVSFEGHGWVVSFDPEIIKLERSKSGKFYNDNLNKLLGLAGIESYMSTDLPMFYKVIEKEENKEKNIKE